MFRGLMQTPVEGDPATAAESAQIEAVAYDALLRDTKQGLINLLSVALFHLHEQHLAEFKRRMRSEKKKVPPLTGVIGEKEISELELIANAVKHAEGSAAQQLRERRPDLFINPLVRETGMRVHDLPNLQNPLGGAGLFVQQRDLISYADALKEFWIDVRASAA
jgi:hypothetical protein